ncbi:acyl-CoA thioester hydrolase [Diplonema papillatum]|nr:acyl-CoA thioester hydrolase [Diplonema papillatum]
MKADLIRRATYKYWNTIQTRWMDQDPFGHVNNVQYYSFIDTSVVRFLHAAQAADLTGSRPFVVSSKCDYFQPIVFPSDVNVGVAVEKIGSSSCIYRLGIFEGDNQKASALGKFVHVWTDVKTQRPVSIPDDVRRAYESAKLDLHLPRHD